MAEMTLGKWYVVTSRLSAELQKAFDHWIESRHPEIQALAREFPPGTRCEVDGDGVYVIGYVEGDGLVVSGIDPCVDYHAAHRNNKWISAAYLREVSAAPPDATVDTRRAVRRAMRLFRGE